MSNRKASELNKYLGNLAQLGFSRDDLRVQVVMKEIEQELGVSLQPKVKESIVKNPYKALVIAVADCSGSMGIWEKSVAKEYYDLALQSIKEKYISVEEVFIAHSTEAELTTKKELFTSGKSGGTIVSSIFKILQEKLNTEKEVIILQFSDGDNLSSDNDRVVKRLIEEVLPNVKYFKYIEANQYARHSGLMKAYKNITENNFSILNAKTNDDALKGMRLRNELESL